MVDWRSDAREKKIRKEVVCRMMFSLEKGKKEDARCKIVKERACRLRTSQLNCNHESYVCSGLVLKCSGVEILWSWILLNCLDHLVFELF